MRVAQKDAWSVIARREPFRASSLRGLPFPHVAGWLQGEERERFDRDRGGIDYAVYSYGTPIAWHTPEGWHVVSQRFSPTTSRHQGIVRRAVSSLEEAA